MIGCRRPGVWSDTGLCFQIQPVSAVKGHGSLGRPWGRPPSPPPPPPSRSTLRPRPREPAQGRGTWHGYHGAMEPDGQHGRVSGTVVVCHARSPKRCLSPSLARGASADGFSPHEMADGRPRAAAAPWASRGHPEVSPPLRTTQQPRTRAHPPSIDSLLLSSLQRNAGPKQPRAWCPSGRCLLDRLPGQGGSGWAPPLLAHAS